LTVDSTITVRPEQLDVVDAMGIYWRVVDTVGTLSWRAADAVGAVRATPMTSTLARVPILVNFMQL
jgi:hypothetical protein